MKPFITLLTFALLWCPALSQVLYNVNFNTPDQGVNQLVRTGAPPQYVTKINFGSPQVVAAFGGLLDQPLCLNMVSNPPSFYFDQIQLNLTPFRSPTLDVSFDFTSAGLVGSPAQFVVLFDTPTVRNVEFQSNGLISMTQPLLPPTAIGSFTDGETFRVDIHVDFVQHQWTLLKNGVVLGGTPFNPDTYIGDIRFSYGLQFSSSIPDSSAAAIDNLLVVIPEPSSAALLAIGAALALGRGTQRRNSFRPPRGV